jgi:hypothetical protein
MKNNTNKGRRQQRPELFLHLTFDHLHLCILLPLFTTAKTNLQAKDNDLIPLTDKVQELLASDRQVILIPGDSRSGMSTYCRHLEYYLWVKYNKGDHIPIRINLPVIDQPN